jgi:dTDP-4-dehydrorhamnose reductase
MDEETIRMKILLTGKDGQVGRELQHTLQPLGDIVALGHADLDLRNSQALHALLLAQKPNVIVNAAAYTAVDKAESEKDKAFAVNAEAVTTMALYAAQAKALLVHYSTDYVFDGQKKGAYVESDIPHPLSVYGKSKRAGEEGVLQSGCKSLILRTSWVFSEHGQNFVKTVLRLAHEQEELKIVSDQHGAPTSARLIADVTALAIPDSLSGRLRSGLYHMAAGGETSWYDLACYIVERAWINGTVLKVTPHQVKPIASEDWPTAAQRPKNSRLSSATLMRAIELPLPNWKTHIDHVVDRLTKPAQTDGTKPS